MGAMRRGGARCLQAGKWPASHPRHRGGPSPLCTSAAAPHCASLALPGPPAGAGAPGWRPDPAGAQVKRWSRAIPNPKSYTQEMRRLGPDRQRGVWLTDQTPAAVVALPHLLCHTCCTPAAHLHPSSANALVEVRRNHGSDTIPRIQLQQQPSIHAGVHQVCTLNAGAADGTCCQEGRREAQIVPAIKVHVQRRRGGGVAGTTAVATFAAAGVPCKMPVGQRRNGNRGG